MSSSAGRHEPSAARLAEDFAVAVAPERTRVLAVSGVSDAVAAATPLVPAACRHCAAKVSRFGRMRRRGQQHAIKPSEIGANK